jgi:2,4-dienoyl-CoA reductase (NADPH2)
MTTEFNGAGCSVNPRAGKEETFPLTPAEVSKKVVVVGGGPGGLAAAMYACERGHEVVLIEKERELGGVFRWASTLFTHNQLFLDYLIDRVNDLPIELRLDTEANETMLKELAPDTIVLAIGGRFSSPEIPGDEQDHVVTGSALLELVERLRGADADSALGLGDSIAIIGANLIGIELADLLAERGKRVHLIEPSRRMATPAGKKRREDHCKRLDLLGVPINTGVGVKKITKRGVTLELDGGRESCVQAETVIVAGHPEPDASFADKIQDLAEHVHAIGDATGFGLSKKAVHEAMEVAYGI